MGEYFKMNCNAPAFVAFLEEEADIQNRYAVEVELALHGKARQIMQDVPGGNE